MSAYNTDVAIANGLVQLPTPYSGGEFKSQGIPVVMEQLPITAERAVRVGFESTSTRIIAVPEFHMPPGGTATYQGRWKIILEAPVEVQIDDTGPIVQVTELWIGNGSVGQEADVAIGTDMLEPFSFSYETVDDPPNTVSVTATARTGRTVWRRVRLANSLATGSSRVAMSERR